MFRLQVLLVLSALLLGALAVPRIPTNVRPPPQKRTSMKVERIKMNNYVANGPKALKKVYAKYGMARKRDESDIITKRFGSEELKFLPKDEAAQNKASNATAGGQTGNVSATGSQNDAEFLSPVSVGGQQIVMDFDSGSSDMWVFNTQLPAASTAGHTLYDPAKSQTKATAAGNFMISYGDGSFSNGPVMTDDVNIGGATVKAQVIGMPNNVSQSFIQDTASNGLVGLAFDSLNTVRPTPAKTFFSNAAPNLKQQVFTANFKHGTNGSYEFGNIDMTQVKGQLAQIPVDNSQGFWQVASKSFAVGNGTVQQNTESGTAIADTGTSLVIADPSVVNAYYTQVPSAIDSAQVGGVAIACTEQMPDLKVALGDTMATIPGSLMNFADIGATNQAGQEMCFGGLQSNGGSNLQIYGDIFFKGNFVAFQNTNPPSLGVAPHA